MSIFLSRLILPNFRYCFFVGYSILIVKIDLSHIVEGALIACMNRIKVILQLFFFQLFLLLLPFWTTVYKCIIDDLLFILIFSFCCFKRRFFYYSGLFFPLEYSFVCVFSSFFLVICMYIRFLKRTSVWLSYRLNTLITWSENFYYSNDWKQQTIVFAFIDVYLLFASTFSRFGTIQLSIWYHLTVSIKQRAVKDSTVKNYQVTIMLYRHL